MLVVTRGMASESLSHIWSVKSEDEVRFAGEFVVEAMVPVKAWALHLITNKM